MSGKSQNEFWSHKFKITDVSPFLSLWIDSPLVFMTSLSFPNSNQQRGSALKKSRLKAKRAIFTQPDKYTLKDIHKASTFNFKMGLL